MKYPEYIVEMVYDCLKLEDKGIDTEILWEDINIECSIHEAESGTDREAGFEENRKEDLLKQVEEIYQYYMPE